MSKKDRVIETFVVACLIALSFAVVWEASEPETCNTHPDNLTDEEYAACYWENGDPYHN